MEKKWILIRNTLNSNESECVMNVVISNDFNFLNSQRNNEDILDNRFDIFEYCNENEEIITARIQEAIYCWARASVNIRKNNIDSACYIVATNLEDFEYCSDEGDEYEEVEELLNNFSEDCPQDLVCHLSDKLWEPIISSICYY